MPLSAMLAVEPLEQVELATLVGAGGEGVSDIFDQLVEVGVAGVDVGALVDAGEEPGLPVLRFLDRVAARAHGNEAGQVLILGAETVGEPGTHRRPDEPGLAAVHQEQ